MMNYLQQLKLLQEYLDLTQQQLADMFGVSFPSINSWLNGKSVPRKLKQELIYREYIKIIGKTPAISISYARINLIEDARKKNNILSVINRHNDIRDSLVLALTYHTDKIEGSTLTMRETQAILFENQTVNKSLIEQLEAKNHQTAWNFLLKQMTEESFMIDEKFVLKLHSILMNGILEDAGAYRNHPVRIVGSRTVTANYIKVPLLIEELVLNINRETDDFLKHCAEVHSRFEQIHPFGDGNGRIGRLLLQSMLLKNNYPPAIIEQDKKIRYYEVLEKSQIKENSMPLTELIVEGMLVGLKIIVIKQV